MNRQTPVEKIRWLECKNTTGDTIPAYGLVEPVSPGTDSRGVIQVQKPSADGSDCYVNGPSPIAPNDYGVCTNDFPAWAAYDDGDTPAVGDTWGAASGSYMLTSGKAGFTIRSEDPDSNGIVQVTKDGGSGGTTSISKSLVRADSLFGVHDASTGHDIYLYKGHSIKYDGALALGIATEIDVCWIMQRTTNGAEPAPMVTLDVPYEGTLAANGAFFAFDGSFPEDFRQIYVVVPAPSTLRVTGKSSGSGNDVTHYGVDEFTFALPDLVSGTNDSVDIGLQNLDLNVTCANNNITSNAAWVD